MALTGRVFYASDLFHPSDARECVRPSAIEATAVPAPSHPSIGRDHFEVLFAGQADPWKYTSEYEQRKYEHTLALLPAGSIDRALEIGCAEGHFTLQVAPYVGSLIAADISQVALKRAAVRCQAHTNVRFTRLDLARDDLPGGSSLIICSEMLYYLGSHALLSEVAGRMSAALQPGGHILLTHANLAVDEPDEVGFDWGDPFGAKVIGETFTAVPDLALIRELRTPLYRVQLFQKCGDSAGRGNGATTYRQPRIREFTQHAAPSPEVAARIRQPGAVAVQPANNPPAASTTERLPILMYHRIGSSGVDCLEKYRVRPEEFDEQLSFLRDAGYYSVSLADWQTAMASHAPLPGRAVLFTFDDGYRDFLTDAWPLLKKYGFRAMVFLVAGQVGRTNAWDQQYGERLSLLDWEEIRQLQTEGVEFGSHTVSHRRLSALDPTKIAREALRSRVTLEDKLGHAITAMAYPFGDEDPLVRHIVGACGYVYGLSCRPGHRGLWDSLLCLPRIEISGTDTFGDFVSKIYGQ